MGSTIGLPFKGKQRLIAFAARFVGICPDFGVFLISVHRFDGRVQIQNTFVRQQGSDQIAIQFLQVLLNRWNKRRRSKEFLRQQRMMRTASAQKALYQCIVLQEAKMKDAFATEQPTDEQIEQNFGKREQGVAAFGQANPLKDSFQLDFFQVREQRFASRMGGRLFERKFGFHFGDGCGTLHLEGAPFLGWCCFR